MDKETLKYMTLSEMKNYREELGREIKKREHNKLLLNSIDNLRNDVLSNKIQITSIKCICDTRSRPCKDGYMIHEQTGNYSMVINYRKSVVSKS